MNATIELAEPRTSFQRIILDDPAFIDEDVRQDSLSLSALLGKGRVLALSALSLLALGVASWAVVDTDDRGTAEVGRRLAEKSMDTGFGLALFAALMVLIVGMAALATLRSHGGRTDP